MLPTLTSWVENGTRGWESSTVPLSQAAPKTIPWIHLISNPSVTLVEPYRFVDWCLIRIKGSACLRSKAGERGPTTNGKILKDGLCKTSSKGLNVTTSNVKR